MVSNCRLVIVVVQESEFSGVPLFPGGHMPRTETTTASGGTSSTETEGCGGVAAGGVFPRGPGYCEYASTDARARMQVARTPRIISKDLPEHVSKEKSGGGMGSCYHNFIRRW